jgi:hypothetical protein
MGKTFVSTGLVLLIMLSGFVLIGFNNFGIADPQQSTSSPASPYATPTQSLLNGLTPHPSETPTPTQEPIYNSTSTPAAPTSTPMPTLAPATTPTPTPTLTPTPIPSTSPNSSETPTPTPSLTPTPIPTPTQTPTPSPTPTTPAPTSNPSQTRFITSGYILDFNGKGINGAMIIFNVPDITPAVYSNASGYYSMSAPAGNYHINVWPPFDSNYIFYDQPAFSVNSDKNKNMTLLTGCKVSGYVTDSSGAPVSGGLVFLGDYFSGWFSKSTGYYFASAPPGNYTLTARPRAGYNHFLVHTEYNFVLNGNATKNIVVDSSSPTTSPTPSPPTPTSNVLNLQMQPRLDGTALFTNEKIHTSPKSVQLLIPKNASEGSSAMALYPYSGTLSSIQSFSIFASYIHALPRFMLCLDKDGNGYAETFLLSDYQASSNGEWKAISGGGNWGWTETNIQMTNYGNNWNPLSHWASIFGNAKVQFVGIVLEYWAVDPDGYGEPLYADELIMNGITYKIAPYGTTPTPTPNPTSPPIPNQQLFTVISNSTITELSFNSTTLSLSFTTSGSNGTVGYTKAMILKTLAQTFTGISVSLDGKQLNFTVSASNEFWIIEFTYSHSTHRIIVDLPHSI